ncbi:hypothetical protein CWB68_04140 [Pseudoalteromonas sp. S979]|nr:hypothetical protein CWB83_13350 [Pseudoalteromonas sp. S1691]TMS71430.1 hypothetical protein CWB86_05230 [Pseudoalteromonas sp. S1731]TMS73152.1 hypothetical protein CWB88_12870 [Pseudoalteromonas sp. S1941]TMS76074.1 hypothetical protein CWB82_18225 [Pseudoalteromonas sp. S1690]TMS86278.1 hypothetical protein CWB70_04720 [Pseudoalteromonas sp. S981]TMS87744.1 hypothetical protein CWB69_18525 [Pseudoalteromonas sp. S980]TMS98299.1 hypothetical protein CWB68_04140 [Pseudoalteromonas sp. S9
MYKLLYQSAIISNHFAGLNVSLSALKNSHLEQLNSEFFALLSTRFSILKIDYLLMRIGIISTFNLNNLFCELVLFIVFVSGFFLC